MLDDKKRHRMRDKLLRGVLPVAPPYKVYGGKSSQHHPCDGCNEPIAAGNMNLKRSASTSCPVSITWLAATMWRKRATGCSRNV